MRIGVAGRPGETLRRQPQVAAHQGDGVDEIGDGLSYSTLDHGVAFLQRVGGQGDPGKESQQDRRGAGDGQVDHWRRLHAQMGPHLLKSDLSCQRTEPFQDLRRVCRRVGAQQGWGAKAPCRIILETTAVVLSRGRQAAFDLRGGTPTASVGGATLTTPTCEPSAEGRSSSSILPTTQRPSSGCLAS